MKIYRNSLKLQNVALQQLHVAEAHFAILEAISITKLRKEQNIEHNGNTNPL
jgi:hypothetical protein